MDFGKLAKQAKRARLALEVLHASGHEYPMLKLDLVRAIRSLERLRNWAASVDEAFPRFPEIAFSSLNEAVEQGTEETVRRLTGAMAVLEAKKAVIKEWASARGRRGGESKSDPKLTAVKGTLAKVNSARRQLREGKK